MATFVRLSTKAKVPIVGLGTWQVNNTRFPGGALGIFSCESGIWGGASSALEPGRGDFPFSGMIRAAELQVWLFPVTVRVHEQVPNFKAMLDFIKPQWFSRAVSLSAALPSERSLALGHRKGVVGGGMSGRRRSRHSLDARCVQHPSALGLARNVEGSSGLTSGY